MRRLEDRVKGAMAGVAIGDALGATLEFMTRDEIVGAYYGLEDIPLRWLNKLIVKDEIIGLAVQLLNLGVAILPKTTILK